MTFRPHNVSSSATLANPGVALQGGRSFRSFAEHLLSQQIWCWGQDIMHPEGNWLLEVGFQRERPPVDREKCTSVYTLRLPKGRCVVLRGFGVFWGDEQYGGVFLRRFEFTPLYSQVSSLECPPWTQEDMPELSSSEISDATARHSLLLGLVNWIRDYEERVATELGQEYRQAVLDKWDNGRRPIVPAEDVAGAWTHVINTLTADPLQ